MNKAKVLKAVRGRGHSRCADCDMTDDEHLSYFGRRLHAHRLVPDGGYTIANCVLLCRMCHQARHGAKQFRIGFAKWPRQKASFKLRTYRLDKKTVQTIGRLAKQLNRSQSWIVRHAIAQKCEKTSWE